MVLEVADRNIGGKGRPGMLAAMITALKGDIKPSPTLLIPETRYMYW
jgi:hypothetical protein